ncbi:MAG: zeta toxin family protein [Candidatus Andersenbacteria bacterium]|nr:zeta toxin family protein [Candidatus Andersenbacteria bacterium]
MFMAGSPGAGKTEVSKRLLSRFEQKPLRIDADEIRTLMPGYVGANACLFQKAATKGVHILYDLALEKSYNAILDGTFAYYDVLQNIQRSLDRGRKVEIFFVYQSPYHAWGFTKKRGFVAQLP